MSQATQTKTLPERLRQQSPLGWVLRCGLVAMAVSASMGLRLSLEAWVGPGLPTYITFYPAVMVVALLAGFAPGALTTVLICFMTAYWILPPGGQLTVDSPVDRLGVLIFFSMGLFMSAVAELYRRNRDKAAAYERKEALKESQEILRRQSELLDPARAQIIAREMLRVLSEHSDVGGVQKSSGTLRNASALVTWGIRIAGVTAILIGVFHLAAWLGGFAAQWSMKSGQIIMKTNMALCQILSGVALLLLSPRFVALGCERQDNRELKTSETSPLQLSHVAGVVFSVIVLAIGLLTLSEHLFHLDLGLDQLLAREAPGAMGTVSPNRMGVPGSLSLTLMGAGLLALALRKWTTVSCLGLAVCVVNLLPAVGFLYGFGPFYSHRLTGIAWPTVLVMSMLGLGLVMAHREAGLMALILRDDLGGVLLRRLLPAALLVPLLLGWLIRQGELRGLYDLGMGTALFALLMITALGALIWWTARELNRSDAVRRKTEAEMRNLTEVMNHAQEPLIVREVGGVVRVWNRGAESLYGWPAADALGQSKQTLLRPEGHTLEEIDSQLERTGHWAGELIQTTRDGRRVIVESRQTASHIGDGQLLILESNLDITERKRSEDALRESRERLDLALASSKMATFDWDIVNNRRNWSDGVHNLLGSKPETFTGTTEEFFRIIHPSDRSTVQAALARAVETIGDYKTEYRAVWPDGSIHHISARGKVHCDDAGRPVMMTGVCWDITERKQIEETLNQLNEDLESRVSERTKELALALHTLQVETAERIQAVEALREKEQMLIQQSRQAALGEMIGNIAHQWRQPLNVLALQVQQLLLLYDLGKVTRESLNGIVSSSMEQIRHMSRTIDDFRHYFRPDKGKTEFELSGVITNTLSLIGESFRNEKIRIEVMTIDDPVITGYRNEFAQVLINILNNAREVLIEREIEAPRVIITTCTESDRAVISIADNAGGIPEEIIGKIFDPYFTTKGPQTGTGVGLFMSKTIIEKNMSGRLTVRNTAIGAEFRIEV